MATRLLLPAYVYLGLLAGGDPLLAQTRGSAAIEQVPAAHAATAPPRTAIRVAPIDPSRSSATVQSATAESAPPALTPAEQTACRTARAQNRPGPKGIDCVQAATQPAPLPSPRVAGPTAETSLLGMLGETFDSGAGASIPAEAASADEVARQLSTGVVQGSVGNDAAASIARDRAASPPPSPR